MSAIHPSTAGNDVSALYSKLNWRLLPFLVTCYMFAYLDRVNVGFAKLQMQTDLGFSDAAYGVGAGIFFIGYVLFELPSNLMLPRVGARRTFSRILVLWGITSACMLFVRNVPAFYAMRFLLGVFEAGFCQPLLGLELGDACRFFDDGAAISRTTAEDLSDATLFDKGIRFRSQPGAHEEFLDITQAAEFSV